MENKEFAKIYVSGFSNPFLISEDTYINGYSYTEAEFAAVIEEIMSDKETTLIQLSYPESSDIYLISKSHISAIHRKHYFYE